MAIAEKYRIAFISLEEWGNELLNNFFSIGIKEISEEIEIDDFWKKLDDFKQNFNEKGAMDWIATFEGYDSYEELEQDEACQYAYEKAMSEP